MTRTITTEAELDALIVQSVVLLSSGQVFARVDQTPGGCDWQGIGDGDYWWPRGILAEHDGPITVLWDASQPAPTVKPGWEVVVAIGKAAMDAHEALPYTTGSADDLTDEERWERVGEAAIVLLPGRTEAEVLREAAYSGHFGTAAQSTLLRKAEALERRPILADLSREGHATSPHGDGFTTTRDDDERGEGRG